MMSSFVVPRLLRMPALNAVGAGLADAAGVVGWGFARFRRSGFLLVRLAYVSPPIVGRAFGALTGLGRAGAFAGRACRRLLWADVDQLEGVVWRFPRMGTCCQVRPSMGRLLHNNYYVTEK